MAIPPPPPTPRGKPNFKELRRLAKDRPALLHLVKQMERAWDQEENHGLQGSAIE